jgi:hypothetical protein
VVINEFAQDLKISFGSNEGLKDDLLIPLVCSHERIERSGKSRKATFAIYEQLRPRNQVYSKEDLNSLLDMLEADVNKMNVVEKQLTTRGCPQSHVLSFPTLNAINYASYLGTEYFFPGLRGQGYGDDFIGSHENKDACVMLLTAREGFGMITNKTATGISRGGEKGLAVFCEMVFSTEDGKLVENAKPRPVNSVFRSKHKQATMTSYESFVEDMTDISRMLEKRHREVFDVINTDVDAVKSTQAFRQTYPRFILNRIIRKCVGIDSAVATKKSAEAIFAFLESQILLFAPSSKNTPTRVDPRSQTVGLLISLEFHSKVSLEFRKFSNVREFKFRDFPAFANAGGALEAIRKVFIDDNLDLVRHVLGLRA